MRVLNSEETDTIEREFEDNVTLIFEYWYKKEDGYKQYIQHWGNYLADCRDERLAEGETLEFIADAICGNAANNFFYAMGKKYDMTDDEILDKLVAKVLE